MVVWAVAWAVWVAWETFNHSIIDSYRGGGSMYMMMVDDNEYEIYTVLLFVYDNSGGSGVYE